MKCWENEARMKSCKFSNLNRSQQERLAFIEFRLQFLGDIRRQDLLERFGIAPAVATRDLAAYREVVPENIAFEGSRKRYVIGEGFQPTFEFKSEQVLSALSRGFGDSVCTARGGYLNCDFPLRLNQPLIPVLSIITRAIHQQQVLRITYHSLNEGPSERDIVPFALADSGLRWHTRAYDRNSGKFRDLVLTRIECPVLLPDRLIERHESGASDIQWSRIVELEMVPHPQQSRPEIIARDFGMVDGVLKIQVRAAIAGYVLQQWKVDCTADHTLDPKTFRLWLKDRLTLYGVQNAPLAPGYSRPVGS